MSRVRIGLERLAPQPPANLDLADASLAEDDDLDVS